MGVTTENRMGRPAVEDSRATTLVPGEAIGERHPVSHMTLSGRAMPLGKPPGETLRKVNVQFDHDDPNSATYKPGLVSPKH